MKHVIFCIFLAVTVLSGRADSVTRIACVGDSITYGAAIRDRANHCYPKVLGDLLGKGYTVRNYGVNGATLLKRRQLRAAGWALLPVPTGSGERWAARPPSRSICRGRSRSSL